MDIFIKNKKLILLVCVTLLVVVLVFRITNNNASVASEKIAKKYVESMLSGNASKTVSYMSKYCVSESEYETKKLFTNALDEKIDEAIDIYKDKYGSNWDYEVDVIDSVEYSTSEYPELCEYYDFDGIMKVYLEVKHTGGLFFTHKEETEEFEVLLAKEDGDWVVVAW